jgi:hypothetical protein
MGVPTRSDSGCSDFGAAPTLAEIYLAGHDLSVECPRCRKLTDLNVEGLALRRDEHRPIDRFRFRCRICRSVGQPIVTGKGNALLGRPRIWPPV